MNNTIKRQRSRATKVRYFWLLGQKNDKYFKVYYMPGADNIGKYLSKAHSGAIHQHVRPYYLQMPQSLRKLLRADKPSSWRGCFELLGSPYYKEVPVSRILSVRKPGMKSRIAQQTVHPSVGPQGAYSYVGLSDTWPRREYSRFIGTAQYAYTNQISRSRTVLGCARSANES